MNEEQRKIVEKARARIAGEPSEKQKAGVSDSKPRIGGVEAFGRGALKSVQDIGYGAQQLGAELGSMAGIVDPSTVRRLRDEEARRRTESAEFMDTGAGRAGYLAGSIGSMLIPGAALGRAPGIAGAAARGLSTPQTFTGAALGGSLLGATQPLAGGESRATSTATGAIGGVAGQVVARGLARAAQPTTSQVTPQVARAISRLEQAGVPVDIAEQAGSENLRMVRRFLTDNPISAGTMKKGQEATQTAFNRAALRLIGEQGDAAVPEVLARADDRIGSVMDNIAQRNRVKVDDQMVSELVAIEDAARMSLEPAQLVPLQNQFNNILGKLEKGDLISGEAYQRIRTLAANLGKNPALAVISKQLRESVDSALERSAGKSDADAVKMARKQYRNLMRVQESIGLTETGDISIPRLAAATSVKRERGAALKNRGDANLARLARSAMTVREAFPQSGTTPRAMIQATGGALLPGVGLAGASFLQGETPSEAALAALAGAGAGIGGTLAAGRLYQNPAFQQYLLRGVQSPLARRALLAPTTRGMTTYAPAAGLLLSEE
jgi:hypothetical protein